MVFLSYCEVGSAYLLHDGSEPPCVTQAKVPHGALRRGC